MYKKNISVDIDFPKLSYLENQNYLQLVEENLFDSIDSMLDFYHRGIRVSPFLRKLSENNLYEINFSKIIHNGGFFLSLIRKMNDNYFLQIKDGKIIISAYVLDNDNKQNFLNFLTNKYLRMRESSSREKLPPAFYPGDHILDQAGIIHNINFSNLSMVNPSILAKRGIEIIRINLNQDFPSILVPLSLINIFEKIVNEKIINYVTIFAVKNSHYFDNYLSVSQRANYPIQIKKIIANSFFLRDKQRQPFLVAEVARSIMKEIMASEWKNYLLTPIIYKNSLLMENPDYLIPTPKDFSILLLLSANIDKIISKDNFSFIGPAQIMDKLKSQDQIYFSKKQISNYFTQLQKDEFEFVYYEFIEDYTKKQSLLLDIPEIIVLRKDTIVIGEKLLPFINKNLKKIDKIVVESFLENWIEQITNLQVKPEMLSDRHFNKQIDILAVDENPDFFGFLYELKLFIDKNPTRFQSEDAIHLVNIVNSWHSPNSILKINRADLYAQALHSAEIGFFNKLIFQIKGWFIKKTQKTIWEQADLLFEKASFIKEINKSKDKKLKTLNIEFDSFEKLHKRMDFLWQQIDLPRIEIINRSSLDLSIKDIIRSKKKFLVFDKDLFQQIANDYLNKVTQDAIGLKDNKFLREYIFLKMIEVYTKEI